jgi:hypothetical protein
MISRLFPFGSSQYAAAAVVGVDRVRLAMERVGPVVQPVLLDAGEDLVELRFADQEGLVGGNRLAVVVGEVQAHVSGRLHLQEWSVAGGRWQAENLDKEARRLFLVPDADDVVVRLDGHGSSSVGSLRADKHGAERRGGLAVPSGQPCGDPVSWVRRSRGDSKGVERCDADGHAEFRPRPTDADSCSCSASATAKTCWASPRHAMINTAGPAAPPTLDRITWITPNTEQSALLSPNPLMILPW